MNKLMMLAIVGLLAVTVPAAADAVPTAPCDASAEYTTVGLAGAHEDVTPKTMPSFPDAIMALDDGAYQEHSVVTYRYRIDLSGSASVPNAEVGDLRFILRWDNGISDYDFFMYDAEGHRLPSNNRGPLGGDISGVETNFLPEIAHCTDLRIDVLNYAGLPPETMTLDTSIGDLA